MTSHMGQNSKQINIAKYISKFLIYGAKILDKCVKSQKKFFVHCPFCKVKLSKLASIKTNKIKIWYAMFWLHTQTKTKYILNNFRGEESLPDQKRSCISWKIGSKKCCLFFDFVCFNGWHFT